MFNVIAAFITIFVFWIRPAIPVRMSIKGMSAPVTIQSCDLCVPMQPETVGLFRRAWGDGNTGIVAHDYLAGANFYRLRQGSRVAVRYSNGVWQRYTVYRVSVWLATDPGKDWTDYTDGQRRLSQFDLYREMYLPGQLTLQTCYHGDRGLFFVQAISAGENP
jgi:hypothetical protein